MVRPTIATLLFCGGLLAQAPSPEDQVRFIERTQRIALAYSELLPDFTRIETISRNASVDSTLSFGK